VSETTVDMATATESVTANFAEEPPYNAAHQQQRNEHGYQRNADGQHGESDLSLAALQTPPSTGFHFPARDIGLMFR